MCSSTKFLGTRPVVSVNSLVQLTGRCFKSTLVLKMFAELSRFTCLNSTNTSDSALRSLLIQFWWFFYEHTWYNLPIYTFLRVETSFLTSRQHRRHHTEPRLYTSTRNSLISIRLEPAATVTCDFETWFVIFFFGKVKYQKPKPF